MSLLRRLWRKLRTPKPRHIYVRIDPLDPKNGRAISDALSEFDERRDAQQNAEYHFRMAKYWALLAGAPRED